MMTKALYAGMTALFLALGPAALWSVQTGQKAHVSFKDFAAGEWVNLGLDGRGILKPAQPVKEFAASADPIIWKVAPGPDGTLFLGTGNDGLVLAVDREGKVEEVFDPEEVLARALAVGEDGTVYVGTSPNGRIYRLKQREDKTWDRPEIFFDPGETYIWEILLDGEGHLLVATGQAARLYRVPVDFRTGVDPAPEPLFKANETHFSALALDREGRILVGAGPGGILYRVEAGGKAVALAHTEVPEIRSILAREDGSIYFVAFEGAGRRSRDLALAPPSSTAAASSRSSAGSGSPGGSGREEGEGERAGGAGSSGSAAGEGWKVTASPGSGSQIYRLDPQGFLEVFWELPEQQIYSLADRGAEGLLAGGGKDGKLFRIRSSYEWEMAATLPSGGDLTVLLPDPEDPATIWIGASNPGRVYRFNGGVAGGSKFTGAVIDAGQIVAWGRFDAREESGRPAEFLQVETRTGNTARPDGTWSEFTPLEGGQVTAAVSRYLQYRLTWPETAAAGSTVRAVRVFYRLANKAPVIQRINLLPGTFTVLTAPAPRMNPDLVRFVESPDPRQVLAQPPMRKQLMQEREEASLTAGWSAADPNGDALRFRVERSGPGEADWVILADDLEDPVWALNLSGLEEGFHRLRITAGDSVENPPGEGLTTQMVSEPFLVDLTPPLVQARVESGPGGERVLHFTAADTWGAIAGATVTVDGKPGRRVFPEDGLFDGTRETFVTTLTSRAAGSASVVFEVMDESGNVAVHPLTVTWP